MARRDLFTTDASDVERSRLENILKAEQRAKDTTRYLSIEEARSDDSLYEVKTTRDVTRVLFISEDESLLNPAQQSLDGYTNIADLFDEVHILILRTGIPTKTPVLRVADNVWLYTATHRYWWLTWKSGYALAEDQLVFADGFRPDLIVARDPFASAVVALMLSHKYERPVQVHILEDFMSKRFLEMGVNRWRRFFAYYTLRQIESVRTNTRATFDRLAKEYSFIDLALLPRFNNYEMIMKEPPTLNLKEKYKPFVFIMLYVGALDHDSRFTIALDGARFGLKNPHLGLIAIGNGPAKREYAERAEMFKIKEQVVFEPRVADIVPYLKSANVLIVPDTTPESEELVLKGAAAGIPMIVAKTPAREDMFTDGVSALLCDPMAVDQYSLKLNILMNDIVLRRQMAEAAQDIIRTRFHEDPELYKKAYRESIEQVLFLSELHTTATHSPD
jgi:glycosyltransferase involved in cell wall biosynthesis